MTLDELHQALLLERFSPLTAVAKQWDDSDITTARRRRDLLNAIDDVAEPGPSIDKEAS